MANQIDGLHLISDGRVYDPDRVFKKKNLKALLLKLVEVLEMQLIWGPEFLDVKLDPSKLTGDVFQDEGGISGFCMIGTSHISIHVWPLRQHFSMDVFSCKTFDAALAKKTIEKFLKPENVTFHMLSRRQGGEAEEFFPHDMLEEALTRVPVASLI